MMNLNLTLVGVLSLLPAPSPKGGSDPTAVYCLVSEVALLPDAKAPQRARVAGAFIVADGKRGSAYRSPVWGSMLFTVVPGKEKDCLAEWADLSKLAGTGVIVGLGSRFDAGSLQVTVGQRPEVAVLYPLAWGLHRIENVDYEPPRGLRLLPRPVAPSGEVAVEGISERRSFTAIELVAENCLERRPSLRYVFDIVRGNGDRIASPAIPPGDKTTSWKTELVLDPGETVTWNVRVLAEGNDTAPVASSSFVTRQRRA